MAERVAVAFLAGFHPCFFVAAANFQLFDAAQLALLVLVVPLATAAGFLVAALGFGWVLDKVLGVPDEEDDHRRRGDAVLGGLAAAGLLGLSNPVLLGPLGSLGRLGGAMIVGGLVAALFVHRKGLRVPAVLLLLLVGLSLARGLFVHLPIALKSNPQTWHLRNRAANEKIRFVRKPNVYLLLAESYPSRRALQEIYGHENGEFYRQLESRGFGLQHEAYANYQYTLTSIPSMLAMEHHHYTIDFGLFDTEFGRDVVAGTTYNAVLEVFRANGYGAQYVHEIEYQWHPRTPRVDFHWPPSSPLAGVRQLVPHGSALRARLEAPPSAEDEAASGSWEAAFSKVVDERIAVAARRERPWFTYLYIKNPGHSWPKVRWMKQAKVEEIMRIFRKNHPGRIVQANQRILGLVDRILGADPEAVVVVLGDHGGHAYRRMESLDGKPLTKPQHTLDRLGVLLATRVPGARSGDPAELVTLTNVFRRLFAELAGDPAIGSVGPEYDECYLGLFRGGFRSGRMLDPVRAVRGGKLLETWEPL